MDAPKTQQPMVAWLVELIDRLNDISVSQIAVTNFAVVDALDAITDEMRERLGAAAAKLEKASSADRTAFDSTDWLDLLAVGWEAEAELLEGRLAHDPFRKRPENISCEEGERMRVEINRLRVCALELREWLVGLSSKSNQ